jgi:hypothetical protein
MVSEHEHCTDFVAGPCSLLRIVFYLNTTEILIGTTCRKITSALFNVGITCTVGITIVSTSLLLNFFI